MSDQGVYMPRSFGCLTKGNSEEYVSSMGIALGTGSSRAGKSAAIRWHLWRVGFWILRAQDQRNRQALSCLKELIGHKGPVTSGNSDFAG